MLKEHIEIVAGAFGPKARISGHRIRVQDVAIWHEKLGLSTDEIVHQYPSITIADVYAALAHYGTAETRLSGLLKPSTRSSRSSEGSLRAWCARN